jgi:hypothetical protein
MLTNGGQHYRPFFTMCMVRARLPLHFGCRAHTDSVRDGLMQQNQFWWNKPLKKCCAVALPNLPA